MRFLSILLFVPAIRGLLFSPYPPRHYPNGILSQQRHHPTTTFMLSMDEKGAIDQPVECYLLVTDDNDDMVVTENESFRIVCTSEPDEYAWFNGLSPQHMQKTDDIFVGKMQCVEGASPRGTPEWECQ
jgi:hypothetical protein